MAKENTFKLSIQTSYGSFYESNIYLLTIKINKGFIGIYKNHTPLMSNIRPCLFEIKESSSSQAELFYICNGIIYVNKNEVKIICSKVINKQEVRQDHVNRKLEELEKQIPNSSGVNLKNLTDLKEYYTIQKGN